MDTKKTLEPFLNEWKTKVFASLVDETMQENFAVPPPGLLEPKNIWEQRTRDKLMDEISGQAAIDKTIEGFDAIAQDLSRHLSAADMEKIGKEWEKGTEMWIAKAELDLNLLKEEPQPESLQELLGISEETLNHFYEAATRYFEQKNFEKASAAYFVIAGLDPRRYNVWIALGLSEANLERFEPALVSFSMASITDIDSPYPYLYSAECCVKDKRMDEAKAYLSLAEHALEKSHDPDKRLLMESVQQLKQVAK